MDATEQLRILDSASGCVPFHQTINRTLDGPLSALKIEILQINLGKRCNLACRHCHMEAGASRTETMPREILSACLEIARSPEITTIDITGGAPEMNSGLEWFLGEARKLNKRVIVRSNLAILLEPPYSHFIDIYSSGGVEVVTSLPDCRAERTDRQRGAGVFERIIRAIRLLNGKGYGSNGTGLVLDIVHNPVGAYLPGSQKALEAEYRRLLFDRHGIIFNNLFCITNVPVGRYLEYLLKTDNFSDYMAALCDAYNPAAAMRAMCRTTISVGRDGSLYDCDFNQMLGLPVNHGSPCRIDRFDAGKLRSRRIVTANHCYGCTAGAGSSCQGVTA